MSLLVVAHLIRFVLPVEEKVVIYRFEAFEFDDQKGVLLRDGELVRVRRKIVELLGCLIVNRNRVVSKAELFDHLWRGASVSSHSLSTVVGEARAVLQDSASEQSVIQTSHGYGYRFVAPVTEIAVSRGDANPAISGQQAPRAWVLRNVFVGREDVIAKLDAGIRAAADRRPGAALVGGEMGIGKTRIAEEIESMLLARGSQVHLARCQETRNTRSSWPWTQILRSVCEVFAAEELRRLMGSRLSELSTLLPELADLAFWVKTVPALEPAHARFRLFDAVTRLVKLAAGRSPVVLILDDLHCADEVSLRLLSFLAESLRGDRVFILGTHRPIDQRRDPNRTALLSGLGRKIPVERISLRGLSLSEVARLLEETTEEGLRDSVAEALYLRTGGNPFFLTQLLSLSEKVEELDRLLEEDAHLPALPQELRTAVIEQVAELPEGCGRLLGTAAVIGREFTLGPLEFASDFETSVIVEMLDVAAEAGVIERLPGRMGSYRFTHTLVRDVLYDQMTSTQKMDQHHRVADALQRHYGMEVERHLPELTHHFLEAAALSGGDQAVEFCTRAAAVASRRLGYEDAARRYTKALQALELRQPVDEGRRCDLLLELAGVQMRAGQREQSKAVVCRAVDIARCLRDPLRLARGALALAPGLFAIEAGVYDAFLVNLLQDALDGLGEREPAIRARLLARLSAALYWSGSAERLADLTARGLEIAHRVREPATLAYALSVRHWGLWRPDNIEERLGVASEIVQLADEGGDRELSLFYRLLRIAGLLEKGEVASVDRELSNFDRIARELCQPQSLWYTLLLRGMRALLRGDFTDVERRAERFLKMTHGMNDRNALQSFWVHISLVRWWQERLPEVLGTSSCTAEEFHREKAWACGTAFAYSEVGRRDEARRKFESLACDGFASLERNVNWIASISLLSDVCIDLGDVSRASQLYELLRPFAERYVVTGLGIACLGSAARPLGRLAGSLRRWDEAESYFRLALQGNRQIGSPPWVAHTECDYAEMLLARGRSGDCQLAAKFMHEALGIADRLGMKALGSRIRRLCRS